MSDAESPRRRLTRSATREQNGQNGESASSSKGKSNGRASAKEAAKPLKARSTPTKRKVSTRAPSASESSDLSEDEPSEYEASAVESETESAPSNESTPPPSPKRRKTAANGKKGPNLSKKTPKKARKPTYDFPDDPIPLDEEPPELDWDTALPDPYEDVFDYDFKAALEHVCNVTPFFRQVLARKPIRKDMFNFFRMQKSTAPTAFTTIARNISGQQVSQAAGYAIWKRFLALFDLSEDKIDPSADFIPERVEVDPNDVKGMSQEKIKAVGMSSRKAEYISLLAERCANGDLKFEDMKKMDDDEVREKLTSIKGVGPMTTSMFMTFTLCRPDIFSGEDLWCRKAMTQLFTPKDMHDVDDGPTLTKTQAQSRAERWKPYRSVAVMMLYHTIMQEKWQ